MCTHFVILCARTLDMEWYANECLEREKDAVRPSFSAYILSNVFLSVTAVVFGSENEILFRYFGPCHSNG